MRPPSFAGESQVRPTFPSPGRATRFCGTDGGAGLAVVQPATRVRSSRLPVVVLPLSDEVAVVAENSAVRSAAPVAGVGDAPDWISTAAPVTCGVAIDVPLYDPYVLPGNVELIPTPGAPRSTVVAP